MWDVQACVHCCVPVRFQRFHNVLVLTFLSFSARPSLFSPFAREGAARVASSSIPRALASGGIVADLAC